MEFRPFRVRLTTRFRGVTERSGVLIRGTDAQGDDAWGEFSPFPDYTPHQRGRWWNAAMQAAHGELPPPLRTSVETAAIIPELDPEPAAALALQYGCRTAKVKVGGPRGTDPNPQATLRADAARVEAVARAIGPGGRIRVDANGAWTLADAVTAIAALDAAARRGGIDGLEYVEQPCPTIADLAAVRRHVDVRIAADESIRLSGDVAAVVDADAADILVLKPSPLGGALAVVEMARLYGLPVVVSSAMESSVGLAMALSAALALPVTTQASTPASTRFSTQTATPATTPADPALAHGLGTGTLLATDTVVTTLLPVAGRLSPQPLRVCA